MDDWQIWTMEQACAVRDPSSPAATYFNPYTGRTEPRWAAFEVGLVVSRQNGKGSLLEARELAGLYLFGERLIIHSAHQADTSFEAFERILMLIENTPDLDREVFKVSRSHGAEGIEMRSGQRLKFRTRTKGGGRGFSGDCLVLDEAMYLGSPQVGALMPTLSARPNSQIWYTGSAGDRESTQLGRVRARAIRGVDEPHLFYAEWSIDAHTDYCYPDCEDHDPPDAIESYAKANPGLGIRISVEHVESERRSMDAETFAQERLGVGDWPIEGGEEWRIIDRDSWRARVDEDSEPLEPMVLGVDTTPDRKYSCIAAAGINDQGFTHVEITGFDRYDHQPGTQWVVPTVLAMWKTRRFAAVVIDKRGWAGSYVDELVAAGVTVLSPNLQEFAQACGEFYSGVIPRKGEKPTIVHVDQAPLTAAVAGADRRDLSDSWAWSKKSSSVDISPLVAATLAAWGYRKHVHEKKTAAPQIAWL